MQHDYSAGIGLIRTRGTCADVAGVACSGMR